MFQENTRRWLGEGIAPRSRIGAVNKDAVDAKRWQDLTDDVLARPEQRARSDQPIACFEKARHGGKHGRHAAGRRLAERGPFQQRHAVLEHLYRRIGEARIYEALVGAVEGALGLLGRAVDVTRGHEQRFAGFIETAALGSAAHQKGRRFPNRLSAFVFGHFARPFPWCCRGVAG